jgi:hypothetical protein
MWCCIFGGQRNVAERILAERGGLSPIRPDPLQINDLRLARSRRVYHSCVPPSSLSRWLPAGQQVIDAHRLGG